MLRFSVRIRLFLTFAPSIITDLIFILFILAARNLRGAIPVPPPTIYTFSISFDGSLKKLPNGPLIPIKSFFFNLKIASVHSPTLFTVILQSPASLQPDMDIGTSSIPGTQTITNCPGSGFI